jgi:hypothetical protein
VIDDLGSKDVFEAGIRRIAATGTSADRQLEAYEAAGQDLRAVVDLVLQETLQGVCDEADVPPLTPLDAERIVASG